MNWIEYTPLGILALMIVLHFRFLVNDRKHEHQVRKETNKVLRGMTRAITKNSGILDETKNVVLRLNGKK